MLRKILAGLGIAAGGTVAVILLFALAVALGAAFTGVLIWLVWNVLGLHALFGLGALTFWQVVGAAIALNLLRSIFSSSTTVNAPSVPPAPRRRY